MKKRGDKKLKGFGIEPMQAADLPEVASIAASSPLTSWTLSMFAEEMKHSSSHCYIGKGHTASTRQVVGFICFRTIGQESELLNFCVHPRYRRQSVGRRLMRFYIDFCRKRRIHAFYLDVDPANEPALRLYQSFCYVPSGMRRKFYDGESNALLMARQEP